MVELAYTSDLKSDAERLRVRVPPFAPKNTSPADWYFLVYIGRDSKGGEKGSCGAFFPPTGSFAESLRRAEHKQTEGKAESPPFAPKIQPHRGWFFGLHRKGLEGAAEPLGSARRVKMRR